MAAMKKNAGQHRAGGLFVLLSFGVFAVCVLLVLLTGAETYRTQTERDQRSWEGRTCLSYVAAKIRHGDENGAITLSAGDGRGWYSDLALTEWFDGEEYMTLIYFYDGYIRELFAVPGGEFAPEDGEEVLAAQGLRFSIAEDGILLAEATDVNGMVKTLYLSPRSGMEAAS